MKLKLVNKDKKNDKLVFILEDSNVHFANALRRSSIEAVPTLAIEDVEFRKNSSAIYDEVIAHRLGLLAIKTDLKSYNLPSECPCNGAGCAQCQLKLTLKVKGPKTVYASDIKSQDPKASVVHPKTPVAKLLKGQELACVMTAILGTGDQHAKWSPGSVHYKHVPVIKISKKGEACVSCADVCPQKVFTKKGGVLAVNEKNLLNCHLCNACVEESSGSVSVDTDKNSFVFYVESWGQLDCEEIMLKAAEGFSKNIEVFEKSFKAAKA